MHVVNLIYFICNIASHETPRSEDRWLSQPPRTSMVTPQRILRLTTVATNKCMRAAPGWLLSRKIYRKHRQVSDHLSKKKWGQNTLRTISRLQVAETLPAFLLRIWRRQKVCSLTTRSWFLSAVTSTVSGTSRSIQFFNVTSQQWSPDTVELPTELAETHQGLSVDPKRRLLYIV